jgi:hypothetical protein
VPGSRRRDIIREGEIATYHVWSRFAQQRHFFGIDPQTGVNHEEIAEKFIQLIEYQCRYFAVDLANYQVVSNHFHLIARTRPDLVELLSDEEVAWRWKMAWANYDLRRGIWDRLPSDAEIREVLQQPKKLALARQALSSLSWFVSRIKEPIAREINRKLDTTGHCWGERFGSRELLDDAAIMACSQYIDLNRLKAGLDPSLDQTRFGAIQERIQQGRVEEALDALEMIRRREGDQLAIELEDFLNLYLQCSWLAPISPAGPLKLVQDAWHAHVAPGTPPPDVVAPATGAAEAPETPPQLYVPASARWEPLECPPARAEEAAEEVGQVEGHGGTPVDSTGAAPLPEKDAEVDRGSVLGELPTSGLIRGEKTSLPAAEADAPAGPRPRVASATLAPQAPGAVSAGSETPERPREVLVGPPPLRPVEAGEVPELPPVDIPAAHDPSEPGESAPSPATGASTAASQPSGGRHPRTRPAPTHDIHQRYRARIRRRASDSPVLGMAIAQYLALVRAGAAQILAGRNLPPGAEPAPGVLSPELEAWLGTLGMSVPNWFQAVDQFEELFGYAVGSPEEVEKFASRRPSRRVAGMKACREIFGGPPSPAALGPHGAPLPEENSGVPEPSPTPPPVPSRPALPAPGRDHPLGDSS